MQEAAAHQTFHASKTCSKNYEGYASEHVGGHSIFRLKHKKKKDYLLCCAFRPSPASKSASWLTVSPKDLPHRPSGQAIVGRTSSSAGEQIAVQNRYVQVGSEKGFKKSSLQRLSLFMILSDLNIHEL